MRRIIFAGTILLIMIGFIKYLDLKELKENRNYSGENLLNYIEKINLNEYKILTDTNKRVKNFIILQQDKERLTHFIKIDKCLKSKLKSNDNISKIETYIIISTDNCYAGIYESGADAYRTDYNISFFDVATKTIFFTHKIKGHQPKDVIHRKYNNKMHDEFGEPPSYEETCNEITKLLNQINN